MSHQVLWNELNTASIRALYAKLYPSPDKIMELLQPNGDYVPLTARRERVFEFLRRYFRGLSRDKVPVFLQFVTGSSLVLVPRIEVAFTTLSEIQRRPIAHTCSCRVDLPTEYESFAAFFKEFDTVISKEECFQYNAILNVFKGSRWFIVPPLKPPLVIRVCRWQPSLDHALLMLFP